jgi:hypothetical protein
VQSVGVGGYLFLGLLAFSVDLTWPLDPSFVLLFPLLLLSAIPLLPSAFLL